MDIPTLAARIVAVMAEQNAPLDDFLDSWKRGDLDDMAAELGVSVAEVQAAQAHLSR